MSDNPSRLSATKLNKILWYSDVTLYKKRGQAITDSKYIKQPHGPVSRSLKPVLNDLHRDAIVVQQKKLWHKGYQTMFFSTQEPNLGCFTAEEISTVDNFIDEICYKHTATSISKMSHDLVWELHELGEEMPLRHTHVMQLGEITSDDIEWALEDNGD